MKEDFGTTTSGASSAVTTGDHGTELAGLVARLESATGPDRGLDAAIWIASGKLNSGDYGRWVGMQPRGSKVSVELYATNSGRAPEFTASIDEALTLVPRRNYGVTLSFHPLSEVQGYAYVASHAAFAATMPLALCKAALQARLALQRTPVSGSPAPWEQSNEEVVVP
jgi:hypothetical protein